MNSLIAEIVSQNQTLHWYITYNWSYSEFVRFLPILAKMLLPWQHPLDTCNQKYLFLFFLLVVP